MSTFEALKPGDVVSCFPDTSDLHVIIEYPMRGRAGAFNNALVVSLSSGEVLKMNAWWLDAVVSV